jgi:hypothetical protein
MNKLVCLKKHAHEQMLDRTKAAGAMCKLADATKNFVLFVDYK